MLNCRFVLFGFVCLSCVLWICVDEVFIGVVRLGSWMGWLTLVICRFLICQEIIFFASIRAGVVTELEYLIRESAEKLVL